MQHRKPERPVGFADARAGNVSLPASVTRALHWLQDNLDKPVALDDVAAAAGVRPRTLEAHFKQFLGTTPLGWVRSARLARARRALLDGGPEMTVTEAAISTGFGQLGRFAGEYRRHFGEKPSETLKRGRRRAAGDEIDDEAIRLTWRAFPAAFAVAPRECEAALQDLEEVQRLAPGYGPGKALAAWCWSQRAAQHFSSTPKQDLARACALAEEACRLSSDAMTLTLSAGALTLAHRVAEADRLIERALAREPWSPIAWMRRSWCSAYLGDSEAALKEFRRSIYLAPFEPLRHLSFIGMGCAHFAADRYDRAAVWVRSGVDAYPQSFWAERLLVAAAVHAGARAEARRVARSLMRKDPDLTIAEAMRAWPFRPAFMARLADGLAVAGIPRS